MSETALVPYRAEAGSIITTIDEAAIPDVGLGEMARIQSRVGEIDTAFGKMLMERDRRAMKITMASLALLGLVMFSVLYPLTDVVWMASILVVFPIAAILDCFAGETRYFNLELPATEEVTSLHRQRAELMERREDLLRIERLTGDGERIKGLLSEVRAFNDDLTRLNPEALKPDGLRHIREKRALLLQRIGDVRYESWTCPDHARALPPSVDDSRPLDE